MLTFRIGKREIALKDGDYILGRGRECDLFVDDPLVSRRHLRLRVSRGGAKIDDLGSANGFHVNGELVAGTVTMSVGLVVLIGGTEIRLQPTEDAERVQGPAPDTLRPMSGLATTTTLRNARPVARPSTDFSVRALPRPTRTFGSPEVVVTARTDMKKVLTTLTDEALALGQPDEAARMLAPHLQGLLDKPNPDEATAAIVARCAVRIAVALGSGAWINDVVRLYLTMGRMLPASMIDEVELAGRSIPGVDFALVGRYAETLTARVSSIGASDRLSLIRIERFARLGA